MAHGLTIFFSSHLLSEVEELCDRVVVLHRGQVRAAGPLGELRSARGFHYQVEVSEVERALRILRSIGGLTAAPGTIRDSLTVASETDVGRTISRTLISAGIEVDQLVRTERGLEDVYIELTGVPADSPLSAPVAVGEGS